MDYHKKYIKYKTKYQQLRNSLNQNKNSTQTSKINILTINGAGNYVIKKRNDEMIITVDIPVKCELSGRSLMCKSNEIKNDNLYKKEWNFPTNEKIVRLNINGATDVEIDSSLLNSAIEIQIAGSAKFSTNKRIFSIVTCSIMGSGEIDFNDSIMNDLGASVNGTGSIHSFHVISTGILETNGDGKIMGTANEKAKIMKTIHGGSIEINK